MPSEKCAQCGKTVYVVEKLTLLNQTWHKWCFKCQVCNMALTMKNYSATGGKPYCKAHYPMPIAQGETREGAASVGYNSAGPQASDQSTAEAYGQSQDTGYPPQQSYDQGGYDQGGYDQGGYDQGGYDDQGYQGQY